MFDLVEMSDTFLTELDHTNGRSKRLFNLNGKGETKMDPTENAGKGIVNDIMMILDMDKVLELQDEFQKAENGLTLYEFVYVMLRFLKKSQRHENIDDDSKRVIENISKMSETTKVSALAELFAQIDINGDGTMEWEEFTSYIVESGLTDKSDGPGGISQYKSKQWEDFSKHRQSIERMYFFPKDPKRSSGTIGVVEGSSPVLKIYNSECSLMHQLKAPHGHVLCATHVQKLKQYVLTSSDLSISFHDDTSHRLHKSFHSPVSQMCMAWDSPTNTLYSSGISGAIYAWDCEKMEEKYHMGGTGRDGRLMRDSHKDMVLGLSTLNNLETLASASMDKTIRLWDCSTGRHRRTLEGHEKGVRSLAYNEDYRFLISGGFDYDALVWNPYVERLILRLHGHTAPLCGVEVIPDTPQIITADVSGVVKVWDIRTFACVQTFSKEDEGAIAKISSVVTLPKKQRIVTGGKKMHVFDYQKLENPELSSDSPVLIARYNKTLMSFITATSENVHVWDAKGKLTRTFRNVSNKGVTTLCLDDRERKFIVGDFVGNVKVYDYISGVHMKSCSYKEFGQKAHLGAVSKVLYVHKYKCFITASWDRAISIHDENEADGGVMLRRIDGAHGADITALDYSSHLSMMASGDLDGGIKFWDYEFIRNEGTCKGVHTGGIRDVCFIGTYPIVAAADSAGIVCLWGTTGAHKGRCLLRTRNLSRDSQVMPKGVTKLRVDVKWSDPVKKLSTEDLLYQEMKVSVRRKVMSKSKHLRELFRQIGGDGDGKIDLDEFKSAMLNFGVGIGQKAQLERLFYEIDDDHSGQITYGEFSEGLSHLTQNDSDGDDVAEDGTDGRYVISAKMYTGDEEGTLKIWDLLPVLRILESEHSIYPVRRAKKCENPKRSLRFDARNQDEINDSVRGKKAGRRSRANSVDKSRSNSISSDRGNNEKKALDAFDEMFHRARAGGKKQSGDVAAPKALLSNSKVELAVVHAWNAHYNDSVIDLQIVPHPKSIISSGNDRLVHIWSESGDLQGTLQQGFVDSSRWKFQVDVEEYTSRQNDEANKIIQTINDMVEDEERKRWEGGEFQNPIFSHDIKSNSSIDVPKLHFGGGFDAVNLHIEDISETSERLISELSNLSVRERERRVGGIADKVRRTPRLHPIDPKHAGRGYSITPYGRQVRSRGLRKFKKK